jgi:SAM-dependent methyltransferase
MNRDDWNRRYGEKELLWSAEPNRFLVDEVESLPPGHALDLACGEGRNAIWLAERGWRVDAIDYSDIAIDKARRVGEARGVEVRWVRDDVESYVPSSGYDLVIVFYLQLPWESMRGVIRRAAAGVARAGTFLLVGHDLTNLEKGHGGPKSPTVLYTPDDVAGELPELRVVEAARRLRPVETDDGIVNAIDCLVRAVRA